MTDFKLKYIIDADGRKVKSELQSVDDQFARLGGQAANATGLSATSMNALAIGAGIATTGVLAVGSAIASGTQQLFEFSRQAADFGSIIFDASQKTGLSAEKISALKFAADQSGTSLEAVTAGAAKFAKTIGEAGNGSDKAQAKLDRLGVTATDLDTALGQALTTIAQMPPGTQQMTAAMDAFGKSGADLIPFIRSFDGDIEGLVERAKELGVTMDDEAIRAADEFGDQLDILATQFQFVGYTIGLEFMPIFMDMAMYTSNWYAQNKDEVKSWAEDSVSWITGIVWALDFWADAFVKLNSGQDAFSKLYLANVQAISQSVPQIIIATAIWNAFADSLGNVIQKGNELRGARAAMGGVVSPFLGTTTGGGTRSGGGGARSAANDAERAERERIAGVRRNLNDEVQLRLATDKVKLESIKNHLAQEILTEERAFMATQLLEKSQLDFKRKALADTLALVQGNAEEEERIKRELALLDQEIAAARIKREREFGEFQTKQFNERIKLADEVIEREIKLVGERIEQEIELNRLLEERLRMATEALGPLTPSFEPQNVIPGLNGIEFERGLLDTIGLDDDLEDTAVNRANIIGGAFQRMGTMIGDAMNNMAQGVGAMVEQWVLYGSAGPDALRRMTAAVLANLAAQATVEAIMELARGFAALANPFTAWQAPLHFKSAALFGIVAAGSALAGRAIAGDTFSKDRGGGRTGAGANSGSGGGPRNDDLRPISRASDDAYISGTRSSESPLVRLGLAVIEMNKKLSSMRPGDVLTVGISQRPGAIGRAFNEDVARNAAIGLRSRRNMGGI